MSRATGAGGAANDLSADEMLKKAVAFLRKALKLIDAAGAQPELSARVQEALDAVAEYRLHGAAAHSQSVRPR